LKTIKELNPTSGGIKKGSRKDPVTPCYYW